MKLELITDLFESHFIPIEVRNDEASMMLTYPGDLPLVCKGISGSVEMSEISGLIKNFYESQGYILDKEESSFPDYGFLYKDGDCLKEGLIFNVSKIYEDYIITLSKT